MRVIVTDGRVAAGLAEDDFFTALGEREQCAYGLFGLLCRVVQESLGDERTAAADTGSDCDVGSVRSSNFDRGDGDFRLVKIGKRVGEEDELFLAVAAGCLESRPLSLPPIEKGLAG